jgi:hypothetical protein
MESAEELRKTGFSYRRIYDYALDADWNLATHIHPHKEARIPKGDGSGDWVRLDMNGNLFIANGYSWDGASGPALDTPDFMRGSCAHDALYQLCKAGELDSKEYRREADRLLLWLCKLDGMGRFRRGYVWLGVRMGGAWFMGRRTQKGL